MMSEFHDSSNITRARVEEVDDSGEQQTLKISGFSGERFTGVIRYQAHGFSSNPPAGAVGHFLRVGESDKLMAIGFETEGRTRNLPPGVPALYNADGTVWKLLPAKADLDHGGKHHHARNVGRYKIEADTWVHVDAPAVYLGKGPPWFPVMTSAGPSNHVFAGIDPAAPDSPQGSV